MSKGVEIEVPILVVGTDLHALLFAFYNHHSCILMDESPSNLVVVPKGHSGFLDCFAKTVITNNGDLKILDEPNLRDFVVFCMSLAGKLIGRNLYSVRRVDDGLVVTTKSNRNIKIKTKEIIVFDNVVIKNSEFNITKETACFIDHYEVLCGHKCEYLIGNDTFPSLISFERNDARCLSTVDANLMDNFDYSSVSLKYKLHNIFHENKIPLHKERKSYKINFIRREIFLLQQVKYREKGITSNQEKMGETCQKYKTLSTSQDAYHWSLASKLLDSSGMTH
tara:strand:+ start:1856 stop:2695 length:840 start_codon:yes stop_codon:yes gene_type:complete